MISPYRDTHGNEIDLLQQSGRELVGFEIKSSSTYNSSFKKGLDRFNDKTAPLARRYIIYNGDAQKFGDGTEAVHFSKVANCLAGSFGSNLEYGMLSALHPLQIAVAFLLYKSLKTLEVAKFT